MLNFLQLSPSYVPLYLGKAPNLETKNIYILKFKMYDSIKINHEENLYYCNIYLYSGVALFIISF
jgi:hypothetical protein